MNDLNDFAALGYDLADPRHPFHVHHMEMALNAAEAAAEEGEVPVGAVIVSFRRGVIAQRTTSANSFLTPRPTPR